MTPQGHPAGSVRAREGFAIVWYDDSSSQSLRLDQYELVRDAADAAKRATRMMLSDDECRSIPLTLEVVGLFGERHAIDLLRVQQVSAWSPTAVATEAADKALYADPGEREPWQG